MKNKYLAAEVRTSQGNYRVIVGKNILDLLGKELEFTAIKKKTCFIIADKSMFPKKVKLLHETMETFGYKTNTFSLELSEENKNYNSVSKIYDWLSTMKAERTDFILSFGGGVAGDIIGFAASSYLRGMPYIQVPTTLASMTDAAIGGKTGYNLATGKNLVGSFNQPKLVFEDLDFLQTLPIREKNSGWAEAIKHALISDVNLFEEFESNKINIINLDTEYAAEILKKSVRIKAQVVSKDEFERGQDRIKLNYGHTIGHAIEKVTKFKKYLHGEAVSLGMMVSINISLNLGIVNTDTVERQKNILTNYGLPTNDKNLNIEELLEAIQMDKKNVDGKVRWVLLRNIGEAIIEDNVSLDVVKSSISKIIY